MAVNPGGAAGRPAWKPALHARTHYAADLGRPAAWLDEDEDPVKLCNLDSRLLGTVQSHRQFVSSVTMRPWGSAIV